MSDSEDDSIKIIEDPSEEKEDVKASASIPETSSASDASSQQKQEPFEPNTYIAKLIDFMKSTEKDANQRFSEFMTKTWSRPSDSTNFLTDAYPMDSGGVSKLPQSMNMMAQKRIAGTQRLMYPPPPQSIKPPFGAEKGGPSSSGILAMKKAKKLVPVIDDSIYCTTEQPCKTCAGVSLSGNQVLICKRCRDCFHMKCSIPPVSVEEASDPNFVYHCKTCLVSRKVLNSSRSRSPSPAVLEAKRMKLSKPGTK